MNKLDREGLRIEPTREVLSKTEARQGETGHHVRLVLAISLIGVIIAFTVIGFAFFT